MDEITHVPTFVWQVFGYDLVFNTQTIYMTWIVMGVLIVFAFLSTRKIDLVPNPFQVVGELIVKTFYDLTKDSLDKDKVMKYFPIICTLFMFVALCNWLGLIPTLAEPTKDLNTPLSLGLLGAVLAHHAGIKEKGIKEYAKAYCEPIFLMAPLNIIGELAKVVSISFRLYGNIMGGAIIIIVVSQLILSIALPPFLVLFFGLFVGTIQAFVFTMLTLVYISLQVN